MFDELDFHGPVSLPGSPTEALPGSEMKIRVMTERAARREQLFHPLDGLVLPQPLQPAWEPLPPDVLFESIDLEEPVCDAELVTTE